MSKFDNVIAEAAYAIASHGFAEEEYGEVSTTGWNALVTVSATTLLNVEEIDLSERLRAEYGGSEIFAWIRENSEGFVSLIDHMIDSNRDDVATVESRWDEYVAETDKRAEDAETAAAEWGF
jgi:hypothetical protein